MRSFPRSSLAAALLAAMPVLGAAQAPALPPIPTIPATPAAPVPRTAPRPAPAMEALQSLLRDLNLAGNPDLPMAQRLEALAKARPSAQTTAKLRAVFGTDRLVTIGRQPPRAGWTDYRVTLLPLHPAPAADRQSVFASSAGRLDIALDQPGKHLLLHGALDSFQVEDARTRLTVRGVTMDSDQTLGYGGLWFGGAQGRVASLRAEPVDGADAGAASGAPRIALLGLHFSSRVTEKADAVDIGYASGIETVEVAGERVEDVRFALHFANIDKQAMAAIREAGERQRALPAASTPAQQAEAVKPLLRSFGQALLAPGAALEVDEISARFHGATASIKGRVAVEGGAAADLDDPPALLRKIVARFQVRVPLALVREIAGLAAARQAAQQGRPADPATIAQLRQTMTDIGLGKLLGGGFARIEDEVIVSDLEWRGGVLRADGKPVPLPMPPRAPAPATAPANGPLPAPIPPSATFLQARLVPGSCSLPDYPAEVVRLDAPLALMAQVTVGPDGAVKQARLSQASKYPAYDGAVLAALGRCKYIPALVNGKPSDVPVPWRIVRAPGTRGPIE